MKLAAIDIGSNAIRLQIVKVFEDNKGKVSFKKLQYLRFPLRLGKEVFEDGKISYETRDKFTKLMLTFKHLIELYEVDAYRAVATSAMREASNGEEIRDYVDGQIRLKIDIINGHEEAKIINKAIRPFLGEESYIHIDVGGGSTELNFYRKKELIGSKSFKIGSVRQLTYKERDKMFERMEDWVESIRLKKRTNVVAIGTGGNINKMFKLSNKTNSNTIGVAELRALRAYVKSFSNDERKSFLKMNSDRADVIVPASKIYIKVAEELNAETIIVPDVGLKDGLIYELYESVSSNNINEMEYI